MCNLDCRTCVRNNWEEVSGKMSADVFDRILKGLAAFSPPPLVFFGGFGEPLSHPDIVSMIRRVKKLGARVELISNGTLLTPELSKKLITAGLDLLWVSIDGASAASYADIRLGAELPSVIENMKVFSRILNNEYGSNSCGAVPLYKTKVGVAFVAMKRNIADLPKVLKISQEFGADHFMISNLLPYSIDMCDEILYSDTLSLPPRPEQTPRLRMPLMDVTEETGGALFLALTYGRSLRVSGHDLNDEKNRCRFIADGAAAIGWNGDFSPCLPLMHDHDSFYSDRKRRSRKWVVGNLMDRPLSKIWNAPEHLDFRKKVEDFDFAPCVYCGGCDLADENEEDCQGNEFPTCGGCLWAQGIIQCP